MREDWPNRPDRSRRCARRRRWTDCTASTGDCWCACNRILSPHPSSRWRPARRRCVGGAWRWAPCSFWRRCLPCCGGGSGIPWRRRPLRPLLPCPCPCPYRCLCLCRCQNQDPNKPEPKPEPKRDSEWPTELAFVLETSDRMSSQPNKRGGLSRTAIGRGEIQRIVGRLPKDTDTQLFTFPAGECRSPVGHGVFPAQKRPDLLKTVQGAPDDGKAALVEGLKMAAASVDGVKRDALVFLFLGGTDACGQDICAYVKQIIREKPRLRVNIVDLSDTHGVAECVGKLPRVGSYIWGDVKRDEKSVDLSRKRQGCWLPWENPGEPLRSRPPLCRNCHGRAICPIPCPISRDELHPGTAQCVGTGRSVSDVPRGVHPGERRVSRRPLPCKRTVWPESAMPVRCAQRRRGFQRLYRSGAEGPAAPPVRQRGRQAGRVPAGVRRDAISPSGLAPPATTLPDAAAAAPPRPSAGRSAARRRPRSPG